MISAENISKYFGDKAAVDGISFRIKKYGITGLLGPNGAGKTTTLRMLAGYYIPDSGEVKIGGSLSSKNPVEVKRLIGYLPESAPLYPDMIVYDYLLYIAGIRQIPFGNRIMEIAEICGISEVMHMNVSGLSKGYRQRVGLAQAMIHDPEILILDEPTTGLDPNQIAQMRKLIREIGKEKTVILSTHILSEAEESCDRVIIINRGKIAADDSFSGLKSAAAGDRVLYLKIKAAKPGIIRKELSGISGIVSVEEDLLSGEFITAVVRYSSGTDPHPEIFGRIFASGGVIYEMRPESDSLESIFRDLTLGGGNEPLC